MSKPPELWAFVIANTGLFVASGVLTALSYVAYRQSGGDSSYRTAALGFGFVVLGGLVEPVYQLGVKGGDYSLTGSELLVLQSGEGALITLGLGLLFWAIVNHPGSASAAEANSEAVGFDDPSVGRGRPPQTWSERND
ncbi:hypothetical protein [Halopelagius fulvigenes]|uniref:Uncharacterized protein n=1 Tax=Halopelagius fulvigenes TaxID=1198324 RepID=A0ABD5TU73_9EURY